VKNAIRESLGTISVVSELTSIPNRIILESASTGNPTTSSHTCPAAHVTLVSFIDTFTLQDTTSVDGVCLTPLVISVVRLRPGSSVGDELLGL
jgi:hypothetical protein